MRLRLSLFILFLILACCNSGKLSIIASLPSGLPEISAVEQLPHSDLIWVIEDAGNDNHLYAINLRGVIKKDYTIENAENTDWEDLTSDSLGNIYIGDFGNNSKHRDIFNIFKIKPDKNTNRLRADIIAFKLPDGMKSKNFEAFFLYQEHFYIFSKESGYFVTLKVPNTIGNHTAKLIAKHKLEGKNNKITSAAISSNGKLIYLLNHDKVWELSDFTFDAIFDGTIKVYNFNYSSQNEGLCFKNDSTIYITDERNKSHGGNLYTFKIQ